MNQVYVEFCVKLSSLKSKPSFVRFKIFDKNHDLWWIYEVSAFGVRFLGDAPQASKVRVLKIVELYVDPMQKRDLISFLGKNCNKLLFSTQVHSEALYTLLGKIPSLKSRLGKYGADTKSPYAIMEILTEMGF